MTKPTASSNNDEEVFLDRSRAENHRGSFLQEESYNDDDDEQSGDRDDHHEEEEQQEQGGHSEDEEEMAKMKDDDHGDNYTAARGGDANVFEPVSGGGIIFSTAENLAVQSRTPLLSTSSLTPFLSEIMNENELDLRTTTTPASCRHVVGHTTTTMSTTSIVSPVLEKILISPSRRSSCPSCLCRECEERNNHDHDFNDDFAPSPYYHSHHHGHHNDAVTMINAVLEIIQEACDLLEEEGDYYTWE